MPKYLRMAVRRKLSFQAAYFLVESSLHGQALGQELSEPGLETLWMQ